MNNSLIDELKELTLTENDLKELTKNELQDLHLQMLSDLIDMSTKNMTIDSKPFANATVSRNDYVIKLIYLIQEEKKRLAQK